MSPWKLKPHPYAVPEHCYIREQSSCQSPSYPPELPYYQQVAGAVNHPAFSLSVAFTHPPPLMTICVAPSDDNRHFETPSTRALGGLKKGKRRKPSLPPPFHN